MYRDQIDKESRRWVEDSIITEEQRQKIIDRYEKKPARSFLLTFAAIFIGLGFLTFIASNWSAIPQLGRMGIIVLSMTLFYIMGHILFEKGSKNLGRSFLLIAMLIFGAGIFLTGQMYHYQAFSAFPFFIWSSASFCLYLVYQEKLFFISTVSIMTIGQIYSGIVFQSFDIWIGILFLFGIGMIAYRCKDDWLSLGFALSFSIQALVLVFSEEFPYYWLIVYFLVLYLTDDLVKGKGRYRIFNMVSVIALIVLNALQVFFLSSDYIFDSIEYSFFFFIVWAVLFVFAVIRSAMSPVNVYWIDLILFVPVFRFEFGDMLSLVLLFLYSLGWLVAGYKQEISRWVNKGTAAFLVTTLMAYFQLAWDFMSRSLFFFIGGVLLFLLSFLLERKRRNLIKGGTVE
ncbi:DUF2157 domain-containing protein [Halobacillus salinarum]|uniref:DUF2157 domain-containing protein n=1 Tax=Halobacillus salinarum TaxID=2932257 RepID=A0ABY4EHW1_9BACI|nr:DUF2157 domain-containing protein [Halobacillus salinarum]UOQ43473.1 DUF2157 domain-containing protein [Halobacillus salinarum]